MKRERKNRNHLECQVSNNKTLYNWNGNDSHRTFSILIASFWALFNIYCSFIRIGFLFIIGITVRVNVSNSNAKKKKKKNSTKMAKDSSFRPFIHSRCAHIAFDGEKLYSWMEDSVEFHH